MGYKMAIVVLEKEVDLDEGKTIAVEIEVEGTPTAAQLAEIEKAAETLLSNPVIETYLVKVEA